VKVAVLGSGNGGCAVAFDFASHGHSVNLFDFETFPETIAAVSASGGIVAAGDIEGFAPVVYAGHSIGKAIDGTDLLLAVGPAYSTAPFGEACRPYLQSGQVAVVCPNSCGGALAFKAAAGLAWDDFSVVVADTSTLPYAVRLVEPGRIHVFLKVKSGVSLAALPARRTARVLAMVADVYPTWEAAPNVLFTALSNANPVIHPAVTIANAAQIERTGGDLLFYEEGVTKSVGRLMEAVDRERAAIGEALGLRIRSDPDLGHEQGYMSEPTYYPGYMKAPGFKGIKSQSQLDHRYFNEDAGYGLVFLHSLGKQIGVPTPTMDAVLHVASTMMGRDYLAEGARTMETLGLAGYSATELPQLLG
jgi:opine dehydrogenase